MADNPQLDDAMLENAVTAQSVTTRDGSVVSQNLKDQMELDKYLAAKSALAGGGSALGFLRPRKMIPPSSIGGCGRGP